MTAESEAGDRQHLVAHVQVIDASPTAVIRPLHSAPSGTGPSGRPG